MLIFIAIKLAVSMVIGIIALPICVALNLYHIIKVDLEDRRNKALRNPDALLNYIDSRMTDQQMYYILLDEVQQVDDFEDVLNSYLKIDNADLYVT